MKQIPASISVVATLVLGIVTGATAAPELVSVASPDGAVKFRLLESPGQSLSYAVTFHRKPVIEPSRLRFTLDGGEVTTGVNVTGLKRYQVSETYPWRGVHSTATNRCNGATVSLLSDPPRFDYSLDVRAYNDGVAFRYVISGGVQPRTPEENDAFVLPAKSTVWYHDGNGHYEGVHKRKMLKEVTAGDWAMPPVTYQLPRGAGYASITEAALVNFSGMALQADGHNGFNLVLAHKQPASYPYRLRYSTNDVERLSHPASISGTIVSPWRVVMLGRDLNALVNCDIVHNLCPPPDPALFPQGMNTSWVRPGRAVWKYLDGGESTLAGTKEFCRLAGQLGFEYNVVEGYWSRWSDDEIRDLVSYSKQQGVGLWFWKHSRSLHTPEAREEFFAKLEHLGVVGAKIDFFDHEHKEVIDLYQALLADSARHRIMVNFHGGNKPTGEARTWPNELTREAIRGMEASKLADRATHDTTLPFTRYLAGHGDYTVTHFGARRANTTWAHQIATAAVFDQPLNTIVANPASLVTNPAAAMIKSIPAVWDETRVLPPSEIGKLAIYARRKGDTWFLAVLNGLEARVLRVPLSFLPSGPHPASLVGDDLNNPASLCLEERTLRRRDSLEIKLSSGGGFMARFDP